MVANTRKSLWSTIIIIYVLSNVTWSTEITEVEDCESALANNYAGILEQTKLRIDTRRVTCVKEDGSSNDHSQLTTILDGFRFKFIGVYKQDAPKIQMYKDSGMGLDVLFIGTWRDFNIYICPLYGFEAYKTRDLSFGEFVEGTKRLNVLKALKGMVDKKIYPHPHLPNKIYFNHDQERMAFMSYRDLQREDPYTVQSWVIKLFNAIEEKPFRHVDSKLVEDVKKLNTDLMAFVKAESHDPNYLDNVIKRLERKKLDVDALVEAYKLRQTQEAEQLAEEKRRSEEKFNEKLKNNSENVNIDQEKTEEGFNYVPYIIGIVVVVGLGTLYAVISNIKG